MRKIIYSIILLVGAACHDRGFTPVEKSFILLSRDQLTFNSDTSSQFIQIKSSSQWNVVNSNVPKWCNIEKKGGDSLKITLLQNHTFLSREVDVIIEGGDKSVKLVVKQRGLKKDSSLDWHTLAVNSTSGELKKNGNDYKILVSELFVSPEMREMIFHGSLLNKTFVRNKGLEHITNYTYNPITFSTLSNRKLFVNENVVPSFEVSNNLAKKVIEKLPKQGGGFIYLPPCQFNSYKHLHMLGIGNLGLKLDEIVTGKAYTEKEMGNTVGLLYSYSFTMFSIIMDYPYDSLIKETISNDTAKRLSYVSAINYGRIAFLIIESPYDFKLTQSVAGKIMKKQLLNEEEEKVAKKMRVTYLFFNKNGEISINKSGDAIKKYADEIVNQPIIPLSFTIKNYLHSSVGKLKVSFRLQ